MTLNTVIIGLGNDFRGDDAFGLLAVKRIYEILGDDLDCYEYAKDGTALIELWKPYKQVFLIDVIYSKDPIGTIHRINLKEQTLPRESFYSAQSSTILKAVERAQNLGQMPEELILYAVTGENFETGQEMSQPVYQALGPVIAKVVDEINKRNDT